MKKVLLGTLAVLTLAACSKDEVVQQNPNDAISFSIVTNKAVSRAHDGYCNKVLPGDFQVWAAAQGKVYFENEKYVKITGTTTYKPEGSFSRYWPESGKVDFFATKNEKGTKHFVPTEGSTSLSFTGYTVENAVADQTDFIYAASKAVDKPDNGKADLYFRHALSQVEFKARNENKKIYVVIEGVQVVNVNNSGDFTILEPTKNVWVDDTHSDNDAADDLSGDPGDPRSGYGLWSNQGGKQSYEAIFTAVDLKGGAGTKELTSYDDGAEFNTNTMYLIPQELDRWAYSASGPAAAASDQNKSYFMVKALIYNMPTETSVPTDQVVVWGEKTASDYVSKYIAVAIPSATTWEQGKRYVYTFVFTETGNGGYDPDNNKPVLTPITLEVKIDDFVDAGNEDIDLK